MAEVTPVTPSAFLTAVLDSIKDETEGFDNVKDILNVLGTKKGLTTKQFRDFINLMSTKISHDIGKGSELELAQKRIGELEEAGAMVDGQMTAYRNRISDLEATKTSLVDDGRAAQDRIEELTNAVYEFQTRITGLQSRITELEGAPVNGDLDVARQRITYLEQELEGARDEIDGLVKQASDGDDAVKSLEGANARIAELEKSIDEKAEEHKLKDKVFGEYMKKANQYDDMKDEVAKLQTSNGKLKERIAEMESAINMIHDRTGKLISGKFTRSSSSSSGVFGGGSAADIKMEKVTPRASSSRGMMLGGGMTPKDRIDLTSDASSDEDNDSVKSGDNDDDDEDDVMEASDEEQEEEETGSERGSGKRKRQGTPSSSKKRVQTGAKYVTKAVLRKVKIMVKRTKNKTTFMKHKREGTLGDYAKELLMQYATKQDLHPETYISVVGIKKVREILDDINPKEL